MDIIMQMMDLLNMDLNKENVGIERTTVTQTIITYAQNVTHKKGTLPFF